MFKLLVVIVIAVIYTAFNYDSPEVLHAKEQASGLYDAAKQGQQALLATQRIKDAFERRVGGLQVEVEGKVAKLLADDNDGARHQRFIIGLDNEMTLLVVHNIDLAPRVENLAIGDTVELNGVYEWNAKGGVMHWTHHDPQGRHEAGWIRHQGKIYQ